MLSKEDLIYFGTLMLWASPAVKMSKNDCIYVAKEFYDKIFKKDE